jgi:dTDP-glucose pyrophosphorylase
MAGEGSRFLKEGWAMPKPLIILNGMPLFMRAIGSVFVEGISMKHSFITRQEHIERFHIDEQIRAIIPEANIFSVARTTRGAVETCLMAESVIDEEDAVMVMDCDLEFRSKAFMKGIKDILQLSSTEANGGMLVSFESSEPRYSYAEVDDDMIVKRTAEKEVISSHALCGAYFFSSGKGFLKAAHRLINEPEFKKPEYYVSLLYNYLLADGETVRLVTMEEYYSYGTPEELRRYL